MNCLIPKACFGLVETKPFYSEFLTLYYFRVLKSTLQMNLNTQTMFWYQNSHSKIPILETLSTLVPTGLIKYYFPIKIHVCMKNYVSNAQGINKSSCIWTEKLRTSNFFLSHPIVRSYDENWDTRLDFKPITG